MFRTKRFAKGVAASLAGSLILAALIAQPASAALGGSGDEVVIKSEPGVVTVTVPNPNLRTKKVVAEPAHSQAPYTGAVQTFAVGSNSAAHCSIYNPPCQFNIFKTATRTVTPPRGSSGQLKSSGTAFVDVYIAPACCYRKADYYNTSSYSQWGGSSPYNATSIKHQDIWDIDYVGVSWTFGGAPSGTVNLGSGRIAYANTVSNTWKVNHSVQHVWLNASGGRVTKVKYEVHGSYGFGSTFYTTDAYSSVAMP